MMYNKYNILCNGAKAGQQAHLDPRWSACGSGQCPPSSCPSYLSVMAQLYTQRWLTGPEIGCEGQRFLSHYRSDFCFFFFCWHSFANERSWWIITEGQEQRRQEKTNCRQLLGRDQQKTTNIGKSRTFSNLLLVSP